MNTPTKEDLISLFPDNSAGLITPYCMRTVVENMAIGSGASGYSGYSGISGYSGRSGYSQQPLFYYLNSNFVKNNTTLETITDGTSSLTSGNLAVGLAYKFRAFLMVSTTAGSGHKYAVAVSGGAGCNYDIKSLDMTTKAYTISTRMANSVNTGVGVTSSTNVETIIEGYIQGQAQPMSIQFALNAGSTLASVLMGSYLEVYTLGVSNYA